MNLKSLGLSLAAGIATLLLVGVAVTAFAEPWIEFSLFLGIPAGIAAGALVSALVLVWLRDEASPERTRIAYSLASFGVAFLAVLVAVAAGLNRGLTFAILVAVVVGVAAAVAAFLGGGSDAPTTQSLQ